jgi:alpha-L-rhamnosidase
VSLPENDFLPTKMLLLLSSLLLSVLGSESINSVGDEYTTYHTTYEAPERYQYLNDHCEHGNPQVEASPDPLVSMTWSERTNVSQLQIYRIDRPVRYWVSPPDAVEFVASDVFSSLDLTAPFSILVYRNCTVTLDWGVERAAWFELISGDELSSTDRFQVKASISEYNEPYPGKTRSLTKYGNHTYRLETNPQLYEGVRFTFLHFDFFEATTTVETPIEIRSLSLVAKIKPINYTGAFLSSDRELTQAWYTGAYGVRLNMEENDFNSILIERGDRVAIQGDGHPTIDVALVAFSQYDLIRNVLLETDSGHKHVVDDNIMAYPLYWCLSGIDHFMESGDYSTFAKLVPDMMIILDRRIKDFLDPSLDITWFGWDDRLGNGWCFHKNNDRCTREALLAFAGLVVRVCRDFVRALVLADRPLAAQKYTKAQATMKDGLRRVPEWPSGFGTHAAANAINADVSTPSEIDRWMNSTLNDPITICSFSQFNQYWILQGFGNADRMEHALASIKLCWGPMMTLGKGCFWEMSSPEWLSFMGEGGQAPHLPSYCHPWASGVTPWLSHIMGGIQAIQPGYKKFVAAPYVSLRYLSVSTTIATPQGTITVNATLQNRPVGHGGFSYNATIECPVPGLFGIRYNISDTDGENAGILQDFFLNGVPGDALSREKVTELLGDSYRTNAYLFLRILEKGTHHIQATYHPLAVSRCHEDVEDKSTKRIEPFPEPKYPATLRTIDRNSQGDGLLTHGRDGYILLGCDKDGNDIEDLPIYVSSITIRRHGFPGWLVPEREYVGSSDSNLVYLPISKLDTMNNATQERALGMVGIDDAGGGEINCIFVDITMSEPRPISSSLKNHQGPLSISVYFVAKSDKNQHAIRVMDGKTLNVIAPTSLITDFKGGVWWTLQYDSSVRLRLMDVQGIHFSAVAFSSG